MEIVVVNTLFTSEGGGVKKKFVDRMGIAFS